MQKTGRNFRIFFETKRKRDFCPLQDIVKRDKKNSFLKNKAKELLKINGLVKNKPKNKPETKLPKLLKTIEGPKKQSENKPKNKAGHVVENKGSLEIKPKTNPKTEPSVIALKGRSQNESPNHERP